MKIAGIQKLSMVDYPGKMACTIFFPGCNFRCPYCHNSSLVIPEPDQTYLTEEEVLKFLKKRQGLLEGVCMTGGEPLLQGENLIPFLKQIKELGYAVKLDTNGTSPLLLKQICETGLIDYVAMDIKSSKGNYGLAIGKKIDFDSFASQKEDKISRKLDESDCEPEKTGQEQQKSIIEQKQENILDRIIESAAYLMEGTLEYEFRTTLVKGIHSIQDIEKICQWIQGTKIWYLQNFKDSGAILSPNSCKMEPFSENELELFAKTGKEYDLNVVVRNV